MFTSVYDGAGIMRLSLPSLVMINLDWTSVTEAISLDFLRENGVCVCVCMRTCVHTCRPPLAVGGSFLFIITFMKSNFHFPHL